MAMLETSHTIGAYDSDLQEENGVYKETYLRKKDNWDLHKFTWIRAIMQMRYGILTLLGSLMGGRAHRASCWILPM